MTHSPRPARKPRPTAEYRWTPRKARAFLEALAEHGKVAAAARSVGMTRQAAYRLRNRMPLVAKPSARAQALCRARRGKRVQSRAEGERFPAAMATETIGTIRATMRPSDAAR